MLKRMLGGFGLLALLATGLAPNALAQDKFITVASTTSTEQSGLFPYLLPLFEKKTGVSVHVVAQGTGQALETAKRGDADVVFVHAKSAEEKFLGEGHGVKFEHECYDTGHLYNLAHCIDRGLFKPPVFLQLIYGILGGIGPDLDNLVFMKRTADRLFGAESYQWSVLAAGKHQMSFLTQAALLGGNVRVGLEDSLFLERGRMAASNAEQVVKIRRILAEMGLEPATPAEARAMLSLKGVDRVRF